jgi:PAS domain S-box-containing protein
VSGLSRSIAVDLSVGLVAVTTLLSAAFGAEHYVSDRHRLQAELRDQVEQGALRLEAALALPLWNIDSSQVERVIEAAMTEEEVAAVVVHGAGRTYALARTASGQVVPSDGALPSGELLSRTRPIRFGAEQVGDVTLLVSPRRVEQALRGTLVSAALGSLALAVCTIAALSLLLWRLVLRPLRTLERYAVAVSSGSAASAPLEGAPRFRGEVEGLRASIERMVSLLEARYAVLTDSERRFRTLFNASNDAVLVCALTPEGTQGAILEANEVACRRLGHDREALLKLSWADLDAPPAVASGAAAAAPGEHVSGVFERQQRTRDGRLIPVEIGSRRFEMDGRPCVLCVARDLSERRGLEAQLLQSQKMEAVGMLAGGIAHDFNNLLTVIIGYTQVLAARFGAGAPESAHLQEIVEATERATHLTGSLLAFSRKRPLQWGHHELNEVVRRVERLLRRIIGEDVKLETRLERAPLLVRADAGQLEQVLLNLATNARDAMRRGGRLTLSTEAVELDEAAAAAAGVPAGRWAALTVADTGHGMAEETRRRIFEPFFTTKEAGRGTGLGLAIVASVVKQHEGAISVDSAPDEGTRFRVLLPRASSPRPSAAEASAPARARGGHETILLVEDDDGVRRLLTRVLERAGYAVVAARNGQEGVKRFEAGGVHLVLTDLVMPDMDGREAVEAMRRLRPETRVLFMSGYTADIISSRGPLEARDELLMKPMEPGQLLAKIREMLDRAA